MDTQILICVDAESKTKTVKFNVHTDAVILKDKQKDLFQYKRIHNVQENSNIPGSGIGLSEVQKIAKILGGDVYCKSNEKEGTTFTLELKYFPKEQIIKPKEDDFGHQYNLFL